MIYKLHRAFQVVVHSTPTKNHPCKVSCLWLREVQEPNVGGGRPWWCETFEAFLSMTCTSDFSEQSYRWTMRFFFQITCNFVSLFSEGVIKRPKKIQKHWHYQVEIPLNSIQNLPVHDFYRLFFLHFLAWVAVWIFWSKFSQTKLVLLCSFASFPLNRIDLFNFCPKKHFSL